MRRRTRSAFLSMAAVVLPAVPGGAGAAVPGAPVTAPAADGAYAVAVPALAAGPELTGGSVVFSVEDTARGRLFWLGSAAADGTWRRLYTPPRAGRWSAWSLVASSLSVAAVRADPRHIPACTVGRECSPSPGAVVAGPAGGPLSSRFGTTEHLPARGSCRHRIAQLEDDAVAVGDEQIAYARRVRCLSPRRPGRSQVVVRSLRTDAVRVAARGRADTVRLAGSYVGFVRDGRAARTLVVRDLGAGRVAYRARLSYRDHWSLGSDGVVARTRFPARCCPVRGRLAWYSPEEPRLHVLPSRVSAFAGAPLAYADGRIAYVRRYGTDGSATLAVTDLAGRSRDHAVFTAPEQLDGFAFDGTSLAFAHSRFRPDTGAADDGLPSVCIGDRILVQPLASVIEVHPAAAPGRLPAASLPVTPAYRSPYAERPECPYRD